jgi:hypothetical protein
MLPIQFLLRVDGRLRSRFCWLVSGSVGRSAHWIFVSSQSLLREQSFNCGHSTDMFEMAARWALWSHNPGMVYYSQSGSVNGGKLCPVSKIQPPRCREVKEDLTISLFLSSLCLSLCLSISVLFVSLPPISTNG